MTKSFHEHLDPNNRLKNILSLDGGGEPIKCNSNPVYTICFILPWKPNAKAQLLIAITRLLNELTERLTAEA